MKPGRARTAERDATRLMAIDPARRASAAAMVADLPRYLRPGDRVVMNDAATLPASLAGRTERDEPVELRLLGPGPNERWNAVLFGAGDSRLRTEERSPPPVLAAGARLALGPELRAQISAVSELSPRLIELGFDRAGAELWRALYAWGKPIQYAYQREPLELRSVQTVYASRPWAAEMPSAGRPLSARTLLALKQHGVVIAGLTHAAGVSSTGDPVLDRALPLPERYDIPSATADAVNAARAAGARVIAVGTTVVRALESAALLGAGRVRAGEAISELRIDPSFRLQVSDGILTGIHSPQDSHYDLLGAFVEAETLRAASLSAERLGFRDHEFGDACLILPGSLSTAARAA